MIGKNNPFNIRYSKGNTWLGQSYVVPSTKGFCNFTSREFGIRAACVLIMVSYRKKGILTISEIINRFAPPSENNTKRYVDFICSCLSCFPFDIPRRIDFPDLLFAMSLFEGNKVTPKEIEVVIDKFNIVPYKCK